MNAKRILLAVAPPAIAFAILLFAWKAAVVVFAPKAYILPPPDAVAAAIRDNAPALARAVWITGVESIVGFLMAIVLGVGIATLFSQSRIVRGALYPYAIFLQTVPIVAIAPLIIIWAGYGFWSIAIVVVVVSLFPIVTNSTTGLLEVDPQASELFRLYGASRWQMLWKLRMPGAVPYIVTGAKTSSALSVIGAITAEFFVRGGNAYGLGYLIFTTSGQLKTAFMLAAILGAALLGLAMFLIVNAIGDAILLRYRRP